MPKRDSKDVTAQATGSMSRPMALCPKIAASTTDVPPPTNGSRMVRGRDVLPFRNRVQKDFASATSLPTSRDLNDAPILRANHLCD